MTELLKTAMAVPVGVHHSYVLLALIVTEILHLLFMQLAFVQAAKLSYILDWRVWLTAIILFGLTIFINLRLVKKELENIF